MLTLKTVAFAFLDFAFAQYAVKRGDISGWLGSEVQIARQAGLQLLLSMNVLTGGSQGAMTVEELRQYGLALAREPYKAALLLWKWDAAYFGQPEVQNVMAEMAQAVRESATAVVPSKDVSEITVQLFPNPVRDRVQVRFFLLEPAVVRVQLFDVLGREVRCANYGMRGVGEQMVVLDTGGLARGVYVVRLTAGRWQAIRRVVSLP